MAFNQTLAIATAVLAQFSAFAVRFQLPGFCQSFMALRRPISGVPYIIATGGRQLPPPQAHQPSPSDSIAVLGQRRERQLHRIFGAQLPPIHPADSRLLGGDADREQVRRTASDLNLRQRANDNRLLPGCHLEQPAAFALVMEQ